MAAPTVPVQNSSSLCLQRSEVIQPKCKSPNQGSDDSYLENEKALIKCGEKIKTEGVPSENNCSKTQKKDEEEESEFEDQAREKKSKKSLKILIKVPPTEKKIAAEDEKQIAVVVDEKPVARTWNLRQKRKPNSKYASSASEDTLESDKSEFINSLTIEEIQEDYFYLFGEPLRRTKRRVR